MFELRWAKPFSRFMQWHAFSHWVGIEHIKGWRVGFIENLICSFVLNEWSNNDRLHSHYELLCTMAFFYLFSFSKGPACTITILTRQLFQTHHASFQFSFNRFPQISRKSPISIIIPLNTFTAVAVQHCCFAAPSTLDDEDDKDVCLEKATRFPV